MLNRLTVDYVIVGGGMAGLYCAMQLLKHDAGCSLLVLEASGHLGGRARVKEFGGLHVPMGAGVGRERDVLLKRLVREVGGKVELWNKVVDVKSGLGAWRGKWAGWWRKLVRKGLKPEYLERDFKSAGCEILGAEDYERFVRLSGYSDYEQASMEDVIRWYGMMDNAPGGGERMFSVAWGELIEHMAALIGSERILLNCVVDCVHDSGMVDGVWGAERRPLHVHCRKQTFVGVALPQMLRLFPQHVPLRDLGGQPFIRVYAILDRAVAGLGDHMTIVGNELQKIIPMGVDGAGRPLVMIAYADNDNAKACWLAAASGDKAWFERKLNEAFELSRGPVGQRVKIAKMWHKYWRVGTHYFKNSTDRLNNLAYVGWKVKLIGEAVSHKQGWVEGALESVHMAIRAAASC